MTAPGSAFARAEQHMDEVAAQVDRMVADPATTAIARLASLSPIEYDRVRITEAAALGVRVTTLDDEVAAARSGRQSTAPTSDDQICPDIEPWPAPVDGAALADELVATVRRHVITADHVDSAIALWILHTHTIDALDVSPLLLITAPEKRCGKSTLLAVLDRSARRSLSASNITSAALFRAIEKWSPTMLIDEADTFLRDSEDLRGIINSGHTRASAYVIRCDGEDFEPRRFTTWGAKAISMIGRPHATLIDRAITIELRRRLPTEQITRMRDADPDVFDRLAQQCSRWANDHAGAIRASRPMIPEPLHDRAGDNWTPLLAIADRLGGEWSVRARAAAVAMTGADDGDDSIRVQLLADIRDTFRDLGIDRISSAALLARLTAMEDRPWADYRHGRAMTARQLAAMLRGFGIASGSIRMPDGATPKGYYRAAFADAIARYTPAANPPHRHNVGVARVSGDSLSATDEPVWRNEKAGKTNGGAGRGGVADREPLTRRRIDL